MASIPMVDLKSQYLEIKEQVDKDVLEVIQSGAFINGPAVKEFACNLAGYLGVKHVIPCANGTDALQIALMSLNLKPGDEVITTPFTFVATAEVIALLGLKPVFVDIHPSLFTIDENQIESKITNKTRCIIPVHLFGQGCNMDAIMSIAAKHNISVIEDNAQAIGASYTSQDGEIKKYGSIGDFGCTSFFPSKNLGCYGDGGALFTNNDELAKTAMKVANHGSSVRYHHDIVGINSRLDSIQAAILDIKLKHLDRYNQSRQEAANYYSSKLSKVEGITTPEVASYSDHVFHQYTLTVPKEKRDTLVEKLKEEGIPTGVYYPIPLHLQTAYITNESLLHSESASECVISLPMHSELSKETQDYIIEKLVNLI